MGGARKWYSNHQSLEAPNSSTIPRSYGQFDIFTHFPYNTIIMEGCPSG